jgi:hypothetical protein
VSRVERPGASIQRAPIRAWLVTGPPGRLVGFVIDFFRALAALAADRRKR